MGSRVSRRGLGFCALGFVALKFWALGVGSLGTIGLGPRFRAQGFKQSGGVGWDIYSACVRIQSPAAQFSIILRCVMIES